MGDFIALCSNEDCHRTYNPDLGYSDDYCSESCWREAGWHFGPDGAEQRGFLEGTAFQPDDAEDHMDAWGTPHPGNLRDCTECRSKAGLGS